MFNLIRSDLSRLFRLRSLWIFIWLTVFIDVEQIFSVRKNPGFDIFEQLSFLCVGLFIEGTFILGYLIGSDYSQGTIRNKIAAGYSRTEIFFSEWSAAFICMLLLTVESYAVTLIAGFACGGSFTVDARVVLIFAGTTLLFLLVCSSFFTAVYMTVFSQNVAMPCVLVAVMACIIITASSLNNITESEYLDAETARDMEEYNIHVEQDPSDPDKYLNPYYRGGGNDIDYTIDIVSPMSHLAYFRDENMTENICAMLSECVLFTAVGLLVFRRRDVK